MKMVRLLSFFIFLIGSANGQNFKNPIKKEIFLSLSAEARPLKVATVASVQLDFSQISAKQTLLNKQLTLKEVIRSSLNLKGLKLTQKTNEFLIEGFNQSSSQYMTFIFQKETASEKALLISTFAPFYKVHHKVRQELLITAQRSKRTSFLLKLSQLLISEAFADSIEDCANTDMQCLQEWSDQQLTRGEESLVISELSEASQSNGLTNTTFNEPLNVKRENIYIQPILGSLTTAIYNTELAGIVAGIGILTNVITRVLSNNPNALPQIVQRYHTKHRDVANTLAALNLLISAQEEGLEEKVGMMLQEVRIEKQRRMTEAPDYLESASESCKERYLQSLNFLDKKEEQLISIRGFLEDKGGFNDNDRLCFEWSDLKNSLYGAMAELNKNDNKIVKDNEKNLKELRRQVLRESRRLMRDCQKLPGASRTEKAQCKTDNHLLYDDYFSSIGVQYNPRRIHNTEHRKKINELTQDQLSDFSQQLMTRGRQINAQSFTRLEAAAQKYQRSRLSLKIKNKNEETISQNISSLERISNFCATR